MLNFVLAVFSISLAGSIMFSVALLCEKYLTGYTMRFMFVLMRFLLLFLLFPIAFIIISVLPTQVGELAVEVFDSPDASYLIRYKPGWSHILEHYQDSWELHLLKKLFIFWAIGILFRIFQGLRANIFINRILNICSRMADTPEIASSILLANEKIGKNKCLPVYFCTALDTPILFGILKPIIYINQENYSPEKLNLIFLHEMIHYS